MIPIVVKALATLTLLGNVLIVSLVLTLLTQKKSLQSFLKPYMNYSYLFVFIVSLIAMSGSLFFSEVAKYTPCMLCWYQRITMYPQVFLSYLALVRNEKVLTPYLILLNSIGAVIAAYHYLIQRIPSAAILPCEMGTSCKAVQTLQYGYITIPMMALTAFTLNLLILTLLKEKRKV